MSTIGNLVVKISADPSGMEAGVKRAAASLDTMGRQAQRSAGGLDMVRGAMVKMAAEATGATPAVSRMVTAVGGMAISSGAMVGVLAGMAAVSYAWNKMTEDAKAAREATEKAIDSLQKLADKRNATAVSGTQAEIQKTKAEVMRLNMQADPIRASLTRLREGGQTGQGAGQAAVAIKKFSAALQVLEAQIAHKQYLIDEGNAHINESFLAAGAERDAERKRESDKQLADQKRTLAATAVAAARARQDELRRQREYLAKLAEMARVQATAAIATNRLDAPTSTPAMVAMGGVAVANRGSTAGPSAAARQLSSAFGQLTQALQYLNPAALFMGRIVSHLAPALELLLMPVTALADLIGGVLAKAISYLAQGIGWAVRSIGKAVNFLLPGNPGNPLVKFGQEMIDSAKAVREHGEAATEAAAAVLGMVAGFKTEGYRHAAAIGVPANRNSGTSVVGGSFSADITIQTSGDGRETYRNFYDHVDSLMRGRGDGDLGRAWFNSLPAPV